MLNYVPCQNIFKYLVSVNVILFENRIFIDAINLRCGHNGLGFPGSSDSKESAHIAGDLGWEDSLEKGMAVHSSILAWRIPWIEEPGEL